MAIIVRIVSADGKKAASRTFTALPKHIKVPAGGRVEVIDTETKRVESLSQYVNEHKGGKDAEHQGTQVTVETVQDWAAAEGWLESLQQLSDSDPSDAAAQKYFASNAESDNGSVFGFDRETLVLGGLIGVGGAAAVISSSKSKDKVAPLAPTALDLKTEDDTGTSSSDNITSNATGLTITGNAEAGARIELFDGTTSLGTGKADANGVFSIDVTLSSGDHTLVAVAKDSAGNASAGSTSLKVTVDSTAPAVVTELDLDAADDNGVSDSDNVTTRTSALTINGKGDAGSKVELFDGTTSLGTVTVGTAGTFTKDVSLGAGKHTITAKATDVAGNTSADSAALTITVEAITPAALDLATADDTGVSSTDNITRLTSGLTITGTAEAGAALELFDGTTSLGTATADASGAFTKDISLAAGDHAITVKASSTGLVSAPLAITVDATAPGVPTGLDLAAADDSGASNSDNITSQTDSLTITGTAEAGVTVELFDNATSLGTMTASAGGTFTKDLSLAEGVHTITAKTSDVAGNASAASTGLTITVDKTAPDTSEPDLLAADDNGGLNNDNVTSITNDLNLQGVAEANSLVELFDGTTSLGTVKASAGGSYAFEVDLAVGTHILSTKATDAAGNVGSSVGTLQLTIVASPPPEAVTVIDEIGLHASGSTIG